VFQHTTINRSIFKWEESLSFLTPWENHQGIWFKREDYYAPLGYSGPNGSKLRQLVWFVNKFREGKDHILTGASIQSPQLSMSAIVGRHYSLPAREVVYSKPKTVLTHTNPRIAAGFGAVFEYAAGPYNPIIQRKVEDLRQERSLVVEYGISMSRDLHPIEDVYKFHLVGAHQTINTPPEVKSLIVPAGSCNSLCSILVGLAENAHNLERLITLGIGPDKKEWLKDRLQAMGVSMDYPFQWHHYSLHDTKYASYSQAFKNINFDGIEFHPTYEAKMWKWLQEKANLPQDDSYGFWIVGSAPKLQVIEKFYTEEEHDHSHSIEQISA
jgi:1-aminocyclopropane-1-carboxylate deaminase/D-cysteine desulfhydrase-like pyridoxal-dependent ACC family enzyme